MLPFEQLQKDIEGIQNKLLKEIDEMLASGKSKEEVIRFIDSVDFAELLDNAGASQAVIDYVNSLDKIVADFGKEINGNLLDQLDIIQRSQSDYILGKIANGAELWKSTMLSSLASDVKYKDITNQLKSIGLTDAQSGTVLQTSYYNFERATTAIVYEDNPDQRFRYVGGIIPTSSKQCAWLFQNQKKEGYTKAEIDAGIETPFGKINFFGRIPNYNCIHTWEAIV